MRLKYLIILSFIFIVTSCTKNEPFEKGEIESVDTNKTEVAFPNDIGEAKTGYYQGRKIEYQEINGVKVYQGDIILPKNFVYENESDFIIRSESEKHEVSNSKSIGTPFLKWPDNTVYYVIDYSTLKIDIDLITDGIKHWEDNTNIKFVKRTNQRNYVSFEGTQDGCFSYVGMIGGKQEINLSIGCEHAVIHEIGHAIGLSHEHTRSDQDKYVIIDYNNIDFTEWHNFLPPEKNGLEKDLTDKMDFESVMMYDSYAFALDPKKPTMTKLDGSTFGDQRKKLSIGDLKGISIIYGKKIKPFKEYETGKYYIVHGLEVYRWNNGSKDVWIFYSYRDKRWMEIRYFRNNKWLFIKYV